MGVEDVASVTWPSEQPVEVALVHADGDPRPLVEATVGADRPVLVRIDPALHGARMGRLLAIRLGLPSEGRTTVIGSLAIGGWVARDVRAVLEWGEELVVGPTFLGEAAAVLPSEGVVRFAGGGTLVTDEVRGTLPGPSRRPFADLVFEGDQVFVGDAPEPVWTDADDVRLAWAERDAAGALPPVSRRPVAEGDPGDLLGRLRWGALAEARFAAGDLEGALEADRSLLASAGDRCEVWLGAGTRALRALDPGAPELLEHARALWERWVTEDPGQRAAVRRGRSPGAGILALEQPDACARVALLLPRQVSSPADPWSAARYGVDTGSEGALRLALGAGVDPPVVRLALAWRAAREGRDELVRAEVEALASGDGAHPLTSALWIADRLGTDRLAAVSDHWLAARVVAGTADRDQVRRRWVLEPTDAWACASALVSGGPIPSRAEADCLAARVVLARIGGDGEGEDAALEALRAGWPDAWPDEPAVLAGRRSMEEP